MQHPQNRAGLDFGCLDLLVLIRSNWPPCIYFGLKSGCSFSYISFEMLFGLVSELRFIISKSEANRIRLLLSYNFSWDNLNGPISFFLRSFSCPFQLFFFLEIFQHNLMFAFNLKFLRFEYHLSPSNRLTEMTSYPWRSTNETNWRGKTAKITSKQKTYQKKDQQLEGEYEKIWASKIQNITCSFFFILKKHVTQFWVHMWILMRLTRARMSLPKAA